MIKIVLLALFSFAPADSVRTETINGKTFIIHKVDAGETLYAISRKYKASVASIKESNENSETGIKEGQLLKIPFEKKTIAKETKIEPKKPATKKLHTVAAKESLSSIARLYKVSVKQLKELNSLTEDEVKIGQVLVVSGTTPALETEKKVVVKVDKQVAAAEKKEVVKVENQQPVERKVKEIQNVEVVKPAEKVEKKEDVIVISENTGGSDEVKELGLAEIMEGTEGSRKYLALHRTIKAGSIVKVRNETTNKEVFVRVTGSFSPADTDQKVVLKISKSAFDRLGGVDTSFKAEVTYYK